MCTLAVITARVLRMSGMNAVDCERSLTGNINVGSGSGQRIQTEPDITLVDHFRECIVQ